MVTAVQTWLPEACSRYLLTMTSACARSPRSVPSEAAGASGPDRWFAYNDKALAIGRRVLDGRRGRVYLLS